ncbi:MAG TPA: hypothetical protein VN688_16395 [Gemmataceae bacterium]|nr:hypothetical protein [Gemmataceae bacterium]
MFTLSTRSKMNAPEAIRSIFGEVKTTLPGATFPKLAALADRIAVVRSFASNNGDHQNYLSVAGGNSLKAPAAEKYTPANLLATVMQTVLDVGRVRVARGVPKNVIDVVSAGKPIAPRF